MAAEKGSAFLLKVGNGVADGAGPMKVSIRQVGDRAASHPADLIIA